MSKAVEVDGADQPLFDSYVIVDWSARSTPSPKRPAADAIWWAHARRRGTEVAVDEPVYVRTRAEAVERLIELFRGEIDAGRRVLAGFDFPFGYPAGVARRLTGQDCAFALWAWLAQAIEDGPDNANNRFAVAARVNRLYDGVGPFWGRPRSCAEPDVPERASARHGDDHPAERRLIEERLRRAQPVWKLYTTGSVGSQVLLGLPALERMRRDPRLVGRIEIWPFETGLAPPTHSTIAEIYPSLLDAATQAAQDPGEIKDRAQMRVTARTFARLDARGELAPLFQGAPDLNLQQRRHVATEEAWILGVGHQTALRAAA